MWGVDRAWAPETRTALWRAQVFLTAQRPSNSRLLRNRHRRQFRKRLICFDVYESPAPWKQRSHPRRSTAAGGPGRGVVLGGTPVVGGSARLGSPVQRSQHGKVHADGRKSGCCQAHSLRVLEPQEGPASPCPAGVGVRLDSPASGFALGSWYQGAQTHTVSEFEAVQAQIAGCRISLPHLLLSAGVHRPLSPVRLGSSCHLGEQRPGL